MDATFESAARRRALWAALGVFGAIVVCVLFLDRPVAWLAHGFGRPALLVWLTWIADVPVPTSVLGLAACGVAWLAGWRNAAMRLVFAVCVATLAADAAKDMLKFEFGRTWPETWVAHNPSLISNNVYGFFPLHGGAGWASFPSGHTTVIAAPCAVLWQRMRRLRWVWATLPALVVAGLIGSDFHFVSDCIAGGALGVAIGFAMAASGTYADRC